MADLRLENIAKMFPPALAALADISLTVASGECLAVVGPSGCGKTTLLRIIAGLEMQTAGDVFIDGKNVNAVPPHHRGVALLFQRPAFHLQQSVRQNLRMAWTLREPLAPLRLWFGANEPRENELVRMAQMLGLDQDLDRPLQQLSGGQQQRVALGRCLLRKAPITLLDEPLGHLDAPLRTELRRQIRAMARELGLTLIYVTHDPTEALAIGDRVAVMQRGRILQIDTPRQLRRSPTYRQVAELIHHEDGGFNWLPGVIAKEGADAFFEGALGRWPVSLHVLERLRESLYQGENAAANLETTVASENFHANQGKPPIMIGIPAAHVRCTTSRAAGDDVDVRLMLKVMDVETLAAGSWVIGSVGEKAWIGRADDDERFERGQEIAMTFSLQQAYWFDVATGRTMFAPTG